MKLQRQSKIRWLGFTLAIIGVYILSNAQPDTQWIGWSITSMSCAIWVLKGIEDRDIPRTLMELMYVILAIRAIFNWF
jgi:drug/metabolite transporter (DMT)-like permease|tara:strand:+ start:424 stop:657 length:234 start_codon:yes stop_codon:yes gene_type:complete